MCIFHLKYKGPRVDYFYHFFQGLPLYGANFVKAQLLIGKTVWGCQQLTTGRTCSRRGKLFLELSSTRTRLSYHQALLESSKAREDMRKLG